MGGEICNRINVMHDTGGRICSFLGHCNHPSPQTLYLLERLCTCDCNVTGNYPYSIANSWDVGISWWDAHNIRTTNICLSDQLLCKYRQKLNIKKKGNIDSKIKDGRERPKTSLMRLAKAINQDRTKPPREICHPSTQRW